MDSLESVCWGFAWGLPQPQGHSSIPPTARWPEVVAAGTSQLQGNAEEEYVAVWPALNVSKKNQHMYKVKLPTAQAGT